MDLISIATFISLEVASGFLKEHGKEIYQKVKDLLTPDELTTLNLLEQYPDSKKLQGEVEATLKTHLESNPDAAEELEALIAKLPKTETTRNTANQSGSANISVQGSGNVVEQRIGQLAHSITNVGYQPKKIPDHVVDEFVDVVRSLPPLKVHVTSNMLDPKTHFLAEQLPELLRRGGWDASGNSSSMHPGLPKGLVFIIPEFNFSLDVLTLVLKNLGFTNYTLTDESATLVTIVVNGVD